MKFPLFQVLAFIFALACVCEAQTQKRQSTPKKRNRVIESDDRLRKANDAFLNRATHKVEPDCQPCSHLRIKSTVQVAVDVSEEGRVINAVAISGHPLLRRSAIDAARQWLFEPTFVNGKLVKALGIIPFTFQPNKP